MKWLVIVLFMITISLLIMMMIIMTAIIENSNKTTNNDIIIQYIRTTLHHLSLLMDQHFPQAAPWAAQWAARESGPSRWTDGRVSMAMGVPLNLMVYSGKSHLEMDDNSGYPMTLDTYLMVYGLNGKSYGFMDDGEVAPFMVSPPHGCHVCLEIPWNCPMSLGIPKLGNGGFLKWGYPQIVHF